GALGQAVDAGLVVLSDPGHIHGQLVGLLHAGLGRLVVLGPGRERLAYAVACLDRAHPFGDRGRAPRHAQELGGVAGDPDLLALPGRNLPGALGRADLGARLRARPQARGVHPAAAADHHRRFAVALRLARAPPGTRRRVRPGLARGRAAV